jgi:hypothetical protein
MLTSRSRSYRQHRRISVVEIGTYDLRDESEEKLDIIINVGSDLSSVSYPIVEQETHSFHDWQIRPYPNLAQFLPDLHSSQ